MIEKSTSTNKKSKINKKIQLKEVKKLINKAKKYLYRPLAPFTIITYEGNIKVVTKWTDLFKNKEDKTTITVKVVTKKKINIINTINYFEIVDDNINTEYKNMAFNNTVYLTKEILVDDKNYLVSII